MKRSIKSLILIAALASAFTSAAQALTIQLFTKVKGYSDAGWIEVVDTNLGGRVVKQGNKSVTDRVQRGEPLRVVIRDGRGQFDLVQAVVRSDNRKIKAEELFIPCDILNWKVSSDPKDDNVVIRVKSETDRDRVTRRVPIGTR